MVSMTPRSGVNILTMSYLRKGFSYVLLHSHIFPPSQTSVHFAGQPYLDASEDPQHADSPRRSEVLETAQYVHGHCMLP